MNYNMIAFASNLSRAYEIVKCGNLTLKVITTPNADELTLHEKDIELLLNFFDLKNSDNPAITIELTRPDANSMLAAFSGRYETKADIDDRIDTYMLKDFPDFDRTLAGGSASLLKVAIERLELNFVDVLNILDVAEVIAKMSDSNKYQAEHIAEAIQYKALPVEHRY